MPKLPAASAPKSSCRRLGVVASVIFPLVR
jgi:hypothetical protein